MKKKSTFFSCTLTEKGKKINNFHIFISQDTVIAIRKNPSTDGSPPRLRLVNLEREQYKVSWSFLLL